MILLRENVEIVVADDLAEKYISQGFKPVIVEVIEQTEKVAETGDKWASMTYQELKKCAKEQGINAVGMKKAEIIEKLRG